MTTTRAVKNSLILTVEVGDLTTLDLIISYHFFDTKIHCVILCTCGVPKMLAQALCPCR